MSKMLEKILYFIVMNRYAIFLSSLIVLFVLVLATSLKKKKVAWVGLILTIIAIGGWIFEISKPPIPRQVLYNFNGYLAIFVFVSFVYNFIVFLIAARRSRKNYRLLVNAPAFDNKIYAYLDDKARLIMYTNAFSSLLNQPNGKEYLVRDSIDYIHCDGKVMSYKDFKKYIGDDKERNYQLAIELSNSKEMSISFSKRKIIVDGNLLGYVLVSLKNQQEGIKESFGDFKKYLQTYFELLEQPLAYFQPEKNQYVLTSKMVNLLNLSNEVEASLFEQVIFSEDQKILLKRSANLETMYPMFYRMRTNEGLLWFVERSFVYQGNPIRLVVQTNFNNLKYNFPNYYKLLNEIKEVKLRNDDFVLVLLSLNDLDNISTNIGLDASDVVATRYFGKLNESISKLKAFRINFQQFAFILEDLELYNKILVDLNNNESNLLKQNVMFNDSRYELNNTIGLVESTKLIDFSPETMVKEGISALEFASNPNYNKKFSIYYPKKQINRYENEDIDLSDNFLDKILK